MNVALLKMYIESIRQQGLQPSEDMYESGYSSGLALAAKDILAFIEEMEK
jgi:hypothetical protein